MSDRSAPNHPASLRISMREVRRRLTVERPEAPDRAATRFLESVTLGAGDRLGIYRAHDGELDPAPLAHAARELGAIVHLPVITGDTLEFAAVDAGTDLAPNRFGIDEPIDTPRLAVSTLDLVVVPLVAFDARGHRLGHGHGYYDRALSFRLTGDGPPTLIGYAYDEQEIAEVANHPADVPLDAIVTPSRIIRPARPSEPRSD